jgi:uncharacterized membrane protein YfcA
MIYLLRLPTRIVIGTSTFQILCITAFTTVHAIGYRTTASIGCWRCR